MEAAPERHALNCIRVLTRLLPYIYEADHLETWEEDFFWVPKENRPDNAPNTKSEVLFDGSQPDETAKPKPKPKEQIEYSKSLGEELIDTLIDLLFFTDFTLPHTDQPRKKVTYSIWQSGVGCNTPMSSSKELESNRIEVLRLLLTMSSKSLYMPARMLRSLS